MNMQSGIERTTKGQIISICLNSKITESENDKTGTFNEKLCNFLNSSAQTMDGNVLWMTNSVPSIGHFRACCFDCFKHVRKLVSCRQMYFCLILSWFAYQWLFSTYRKPNCCLEQYFIENGCRKLEPIAFELISWEWL